MRRLRSGYYRSEVMRQNGLASWSLTCDIERIDEGAYRGWWVLHIHHGATALIDGADPVPTKALAIEAMRDALARGWHRGPLGWALNAGPL